jgi:REP element-mobilizing transposase RayT
MIGFHLRRLIVTISRSQQIDLSVTPFYHCINRCVRRAFLCGEDKHTGQSYEHRRGWIADKLKSLSDVFAIDIAAYAVMNNHYHLVLRVDKERAEQWSHKAVIQRWSELFKLPVIITNYLKGEAQSKAELKVVDEIVEDWRERLYSISWYMRILNEHIAREANKEDKVTGRFWEGRFKSQALLDEQALIACMAYVDLNPVRAGINSTPETSDYTSIQERIQKAMKKQSCTLLAFQGNPTRKSQKEKAIPFELNEYIALVDWSGRAILQNKRGSIPENTPPILQRLGIDEKDWIKHIHYFERQFPTVAGNLDKLKQLAKQTSRRWIKGMGCAFQPAPA